MLKKIFVPLFFIFIFIFIFPYKLFATQTLFFSSMESNILKCPANFAWDASNPALIKENKNNEEETVSVEVLYNEKYANKMNLSLSCGDYNYVFTIVFKEDAEPARIQLISSLEEFNESYLQNQQNLLALKNEVNFLESENRSLDSAVVKLKKEKSDLLEQFTEATEEINSLKNENEKLKTSITKFENKKSRIELVEDHNNSINNINPGPLNQVFKTFLNDKYGYSLVVNKNFNGSIHINEPIYLDSLNIKDDIENLSKSLQLIEGFKFKFKQFIGNNRIVLNIYKM